MVFTPRGVPAVGVHVRTPLHRSVRVVYYGSSSAIQQPFRRPGNSWRGCSRPVRLGVASQLCELAIPADSPGVGCCGGAEGGGDSDRPAVAGTAVDAQAEAVECRSAPPAAAGDADVHSGAAAAGDRASSESGLDTVRLADIWRSKLAERGWSHSASAQLPLCLAASTHATYDRYIQECSAFCTSRGVLFPPSDTAVLADFLMHKCRTTDRPQSMLRCVSAALSSIYEACELPNLTADPFIVRLSGALVKSRTRVPMQRSCVMDVSAFVRMFRAWPANSVLSVKQLRLKTITLLAIALMLRPSDIAPQACSFNADSGVSSRFVMSTDQVTFCSDGSVKVSFLGIKNDLHRTGFVVTLPPGADVMSDPVDALRSYIACTDRWRCPVTKPLFIGLHRPYGAISSSSVAQILGEAIQAAQSFGLQPGHRPKDFRPTGATEAVKLGVDVDTVQQLGRWKTRSVFLEHYVHSQVPRSFTDNLLQ